MSSRERVRRNAFGAEWLILLAALALAACGSVPLARLPPATSLELPPQARADVPALPPAASGRGGYYMDDGPGDNPPQGLLDVPDAVPRIEPYTTRGNRPYVVFGKPYTPFTDGRAFKERGTASWYGKKFHGQTTSSGEPYDMYQMTAAHPTLPLPSYVRVTNLANGKQVVVRVNDRGPFLAGRVIDLSYTAALKLGYLAQGHAQVEVERLLPEEILRMAARSTEADALRPEAEAAVPLQIAASEMPQRVALAPAAYLVPEAAPEPGGETVRASALVPTSPAMLASGTYLQLGAFALAQNAEAVRRRFGQSDFALPPVQVVEQGSFFRVFSGPFASRDDAEMVVRRLQRSVAFTPLIVQR
jgi:rare lipoprotein A